MEKYLDKLIPFLKKWGFSLILFPFIWIVMEQFWMAIRVNIQFAVNYPYPMFVGPVMFIIDITSLIIHEGGHTLFGFFGWRFLAILGGSLLETLIPFLLFLTAWNKKQITLAQFSLFWTGFTWLEAAAYCYDAYDTKMPLIGGLGREAHDFMNMLSDLNILDKHEIIAWILYAIGVICFIGALAWPLMNKPEEPTFHLDLDL